MKKRNIWVIAFGCAGATLALSAAQPPPSLWRFYAGMPGLYVGFIAGCLGMAQSFTSIYLLAFLINSVVYCGLIRLALFVVNAKAE